MLYAFVEDSPTYLNFESTPDTTEFISLKPSGISTGFNKKNKQPIQTQKPTPVPINPTPFPPLKETFLQDARQHIQITEQVTKPPVTKPNTNTPFPADLYSHTQLTKNRSVSVNSAQSFSGQTQTTGLTLVEEENFTASAPVEQHQNRSQIIKQSGRTKSPVTNDTEPVESLKKNTSQAPRRTTDNKNRFGDPINLFVNELLSSFAIYSSLLLHIVYCIFANINIIVIIYNYIIILKVIYSQ